VVASVGHDLNNVLSTIEQVGGLLSDLLAAGGAIDGKKLALIPERLTRQVRRGVAVVKRLNQLGHTVDVPVKSVELVDSLRGLAVLMERMAARRSVTLAVSGPGAGVSIATEPLGFTVLFYEVFLHAIAGVTAGAVVEVAVGAVARGAEVTVTGGNWSAIPEAVGLCASTVGVTLEAGPAGRLRVLLPAGWPAE
jgi:hypothetical protein